MSSSFPCCNLQNMNKFGQWSFLYSTILCEIWLWNEGLSHDGQQFHQYQQNKQSPLTSKSLTTIKTTAYNVVNTGTGLGQAQTLFCWYWWHCWPLYFALSFHNIYNFFYLKNNSCKASECQHKIEEHYLILTYCW